MFSAIYICFKTLLYTNLILICMNNISVDLLHIKPFHQSINDVEKKTWLHLNEADNLKPFTVNVSKSHGHLVRTEHNAACNFIFIKAKVMYMEYCSIRYTPIYI